MGKITVSRTLDVPAPASGEYTWHFLPNNGCIKTYDSSPFEDAIKVAPGMTYAVEPPIFLCRHGLHASPLALQALAYAPGAVVQRCFSYGEVEHGRDKLASTHRSTLWVADAARVLHEFALRGVETLCASERARGYGPPPECVSVINAKRAWLDGRIGDYDLRAALDVAYVVLERADAYGNRLAREMCGAAIGAATQAAEVAARHAILWWVEYEVNRGGTARYLLEARANKQLEDALATLQPQPYAEVEGHPQ